jgi:hypothetical protein
MKLNLKSLFAKVIFLSLPLGYLGGAHADADRLAGTIYNYKYINQAGATVVTGDIQIGILYEGQASRGSTNVMEAIAGKAPGILKGMGISKAFYTDAAEYSGKGTCDGLYNHIMGTSQTATARSAPWNARTNNAVIMFSALPSPPPSLTDPALIRSWVQGIAASVSVKGKENNPCNWSGRGNLWLMIKVPAVYVNSVLADKGFPQLQVVPTDVSMYTLLAFKLANIESPIPW